MKHHPLLRVLVDSLSKTMPSSQLASALWQSVFNAASITVKLLVVSGVGQVADARAVSSEDESEGSNGHLGSASEEILEGLVPHLSSCRVRACV